MIATARCHGVSNARCDALGRCEYHERAWETSHRAAGTAVRQIAETCITRGPGDSLRVNVTKTRALVLDAIGAVWRALDPADDG